MARCGHLDMLVGDWGLVVPYLQEYLKDFPEHPASANPGLSFSLYFVLCLGFEMRHTVQKLISETYTGMLRSGNLVSDFGPVRAI